MIEERRLDDFQDVLISDTGQVLVQNMSVLAQSETGSGKTVIFSTIAKRFIDKQHQDVIIFVHKRELLNQTRTALLDWYGIISQKIDAKTKFVDPNARVFVAMVETFNNRSKASKFLDNFKNVGLCIVDEAHLSNFKKIFTHFITAKRMGFTATPIAATKKDPLKNYYSQIVCGPPVSTLIELNKSNPKRGVVPCITFAPENINRSDLKISGEEFDEKQMGEEFSKGKQIQNTIDAYIKLGFGRKTICFNASIEHSIAVTKAFVDNGFNARHLDGDKNGPYGSDAYREQCFHWLRNTPNAILCNVGIATTGFDDPTIETVILNSSMLSITLYRQKCGRGARPFIYPDGRIKKYFLVIDMGDNARGGGFGEWKDDIDWKFVFENPKVPRPGIAPVKTCPMCGAMNAASTRICQGYRIDWLSDEEVFCGYEFTIQAAVEDTAEKKMVQLGTIDINVAANISYFKDRHEYYSMYVIYEQIASVYRKEFKDDYLDASQLDAICEAAYQKISEWYKLQNKKKFPNFRAGVNVAMYKKLEEAGFCITPEEISLTKENIGSTINDLINNEQL